MSDIQNVEVPEYLRGLAGNTQDQEALSGLGAKIPRISLKGRKFRLIVDGEEIVKPKDELDVVILAVEPAKGRMVKTFYAKGYSSGDTEPPTCSSADGERPDSWITEPINPVCATCPKNQFGSATSNSGKPSKACRDSKRLSVAIPESKGFEDLGLGMGGTVFTLGVTVASLGSLSEFGKTIAKNGYPLPAVIAKLEMVDSEFPQVEFGFKGFLPEPEGRIAIERNISRDFLENRPTGPMIENDGNTAKPNQLGQAVDKVQQQIDNAVAEQKAGNVDTVIGNWG